MKLDDWQSILNGIVEDPENDLLEKAMADGQVPVGYTCSYVPRALLSVKGLVPVRMRAPGATGTEIADIYLSNVTCSYTRSLLEYALDDRYAFLGGWVFAAGCDHVRRLLDNLAYLVTPDFTHIIDAPHRKGEIALEWYVEELRLLSKKIADHFKVDTGKRALAKAIADQNRLNGKLRDIATLRKRKHPPLSGTDFQKLMIAALTAPQHLLEDELAHIRDALDQKEGIDDYRARLMIVGGNIDDTAFIQVIESTGGLVVADRFCTGSMPGLNLINEDRDPMAAIAEQTLSETACPRMMEGFAERLEAVLRIKEDYNVDGIIVENLKFCDIWGIESALLVNELREAGIPALRLERDYQVSGEGQLRTRVQAFLERMKK